MSQSIADKYMGLAACPLCGKGLEMKCINLKEAIIICPDIKCPYPVGNEHVQIIELKSLKNCLRNKQFHSDSYAKNSNMNNLQSPSNLQPVLENNMKVEMNSLNVDYNSVPWSPNAVKELFNCDLDLGIDSVLESINCINSIDELSEKSSVDSSQNINYAELDDLLDFLK